MPDYASILRRSISALPEPSPDMREAVYQRARAALARQLTAVDPPLSSREIEAQHQELEDAVVRLESEYAPEEPPQPAFEPPKQEPVFAAPPKPAQPRHAPAPPPRQAADDTGADFEPDDEEEEDFDEEDRASRIPALVGLLVVILVVVGIGGYAYSQRDAVLGLIGLGPEQPMQAAPARVVSQDDGTGGIDKQDDRLTNGPDSPPPASPLPETTTATEIPPSSETQSPPETATGFGEDSETNVAALSQDEPDTSLVGQRAIYYYQGGDGQAGEASEGTTTWANITKDGKPAIRATLSIPDRDVDAVVTIYKNYDSSLPASHLVEIEFTGELADSPIQRVPALVLKQTEQARGQPLAGAAVPVTNELFWIALSDDEDQVARNIQLLREGSWFDVPILFNDQTRALLTFEKGIPGDKVFEAVMASWTP
jgi:hypothetical protein